MARDALRALATRLIYIIAFLTELEKGGSAEKSIRLSGGGAGVGRATLKADAQSSSCSSEISCRTTFAPTDETKTKFTVLLVLTGSSSDQRSQKL